MPTRTDPPFNLAMPIAVVLGCTILSIGIVIASRSRGELAPPPSAAPVSPQPAPPPDPAVVVEQARTALAYHRGSLFARCYMPTVRGESVPPPVKYRLELTFDASGVQVVRGLTELRGFAHPEVTRCVLERLPPLYIPPPGAQIQVEVPLEFP